MSTMKSRIRRTLPFVVAVASLLGAILSYPRVLGYLLAADGQIDSLRFRLLLTGVSAAAGAFGISLFTLGLCREVTLARVGISIAFGIGAATTFGAGVAVLSWHKEHVDVRARLSSARETASVHAPESALPNDEEMVSYFLRRPEPATMLPYQLWLVSPSRRAPIERTLDGDLGGIIHPPAAFPWRPGDPVRWEDFPSALTFQLERQTFVTEALQLFPDRGGEVSSLGLALAHEWWRAHRDWPDFSQFGWNDDATSHRIQTFISLFSSLRKNGDVSRADYLRFLRTVVHHAEHLMDENEHNGATNHGMSQNAALLLLATYFPEFDAGSVWRRTSVARAERYMSEHVADDGVSLELAPGYHLFITTIAAWFYQQAALNGIPLSEEYAARLRKMATFVCEVMQPDGTLPRIADTSGEVEDFPFWPWSSLPQWPEFQAMRRCLTSSTAPRNQPGTLYSPAGYFVLRAPTTEWTIGAGFHATLVLGSVSHAHIHQNKLAINVFVHGSPVLAGPGYPSFFDPNRASLIAASNQNTVSVDRSQAVVPSTTRFVDTRATDPDHIFAAVSGTVQPQQGVEHARTMFYGSQPGEILVLDDLRSNGTHDYEAHFRAASEARVQGADAEARFLVGANEVLTVTAYRLDGGLLVPLIPRMDARGASFAVNDRRAVILSRITTRGLPAPPSRVEMHDGRLSWTGSTGMLTTAIFVERAGDYSFVAR